MKQLPLIIVLEDLNDDGEVISLNRFGISGSDDMTIYTIIGLSPKDVLQTLIDLNTANMIHVYGKHPSELEDFERIISYESSKFNVDCVLTPLEFIEFLVNNPQYGLWARECVRQRMSEYELM